MTSLQIRQIQTPFQAFARHLFNDSRTPGGGVIPPRVNGKAQLILGIGPVIVLAACLGGRPGVALLLGYVATTAHALSESYVSRATFMDGLHTGREDLIEEMITAWACRDIEPQEYLWREAYFSDENGSAATQVRTTSTSDPASGPDASNGGDDSSSMWS